MIHPLVTTGRALEQRQSASRGWAFEELQGRLVELRHGAAPAALSGAFSLVLQAQQALEPVAWIVAGDSVFYPPDARARGVDLHALVVVRVHGAQNAGRAADHLVRSGAFGLIVMDLGMDAFFPTALQNRLVHGANQHQTAIVCLTEENPAQPKTESLGPLVSLRATAQGTWNGQRWACRIDVERDKRRGMGWRSEVNGYGPIGMR